MDNNFHGFVVWFMGLMKQQFANSIHSLMEERVTSLNQLFTAATKVLVEQMFINKI